MRNMGRVRMRQKRPPMTVAKVLARVPAVTRTPGSRKRFDQANIGNCAEAIVKAGVARIVSAIGDPDPRVAGRGYRLLKGAGLDVVAGVCAETALRANLGHVLRVRERRPMVALKLASTSRDVEFAGALALAISEESDRAESIAAQLAQTFPQDTIVRFNYLPTVAAQLALGRNEPSKAIEELQSAGTFELGQAGDATLMPALYPVYVRGVAFLILRQGREAAVEFRKILDHPGIVVNEPIGALALLGLARAYAIQGEQAKARTAYQNFLTLWRDADPANPVLIAAKSEMTTLP